MKALKQIDEQSLERFVNYMRIKLEQNVDKPTHWSEVQLPILIAKLEEELAELKGKIAASDKPVEIICEAADIANFAMFIGMNYAYKQATEAAGEKDERETHSN